MSGNLAHSTADVIAELLVDLGLGTIYNGSTTVAWQIAINREPDKPDNMITVFDTAGKDNGRIMVNGERQENPGIMIKVRASSNTVGFVKAQTIATTLDAQTNSNASISASNYIIHTVNRTTNVLSLGQDKPNSRREIFSVNATVSLRQIS